MSGGWAGAAQSGINYAAKARQWVRVPIQTLAVFTNEKTLIASQAWERSNSIYFVSPSGSEHNYGISPEFTARTVAFGAIPVEASLQLVQRRENGLPVPLISANRRTFHQERPPGKPSNVEESDSHLDDVVTVRVTRLSVDGVDLGLRPSCRTAEPAALSLVGKGLWQGQKMPDGSDYNTNNLWQFGYYVPGTGGVLNGTIDVPAFAGCISASGEDVSRLLTTTVSGPGNEVQVMASPPVCGRPLPPATSGTGAPPPGATTLEAADCNPAFIWPEIPFPSS